MPGIQDVLGRRGNAGGRGSDRAAGGIGSPLGPLPMSGTNPGKLDGWYFAPDRSTPVPLVVVLHGCTQTARGYDRGSGWCDLAERFGFAVLFPEQRRANNPNLCFNWFRAGDTRRGEGEALSIRQMIDAVGLRHAIDPARIYVTGLSAGGAMANAMLALYPEIFAGGSIIAGLPYGAATSISAALERMRGVGHADGATYAALVRGASGHGGRWPSIAVWHGDADRTVDIVNADAILSQWRPLHGTGDRADTAELVDGQRHRIWLAPDGTTAIEDYRIAGLGHGTPIKTRGAQTCGAAGPYMLEAGISSTWRQAESWGLLGNPAVRRTDADEHVRAKAPPCVDSPGTPSLHATIEKALRAAGLMKP